MPPVTGTGAARRQGVMMPSSDSAIEAIQAARAAECKHPVCNERVREMVFWVMTGRTALESAGVAIDERCPGDAPSMRKSVLSAAKLLVARCKGAFTRSTPSNTVGQWYEESKEWVAKPEHTGRTVSRETSSL